MRKPASLSCMGCKATKERRPQVPNFLFQHSKQNEKQLVHISTAVYTTIIVKERWSITITTYYSMLQKCNPVSFHETLQCSCFLQIKICAQCGLKESNYMIISLKFCRFNPEELHWCSLCTGSIQCKDMDLKVQTCRRFVSNLKKRNVNTASVNNDITF